MAFLVSRAYKHSWRKTIHRAIDKRAGLGPLVRLGLDSLLVDRKSWASEVIDEELVAVYYRPESGSVKS